MSCCFVFADFAYMAEGKGPDSKKVVTSSRITDFFSTSNEKCQPTATSAHSGTSASTTKSSTAGWYFSK